MKHVKLFEDFINEGSKVDKKDFDKVVAAVKKANQRATVMFVPKWNDIEVIVGWNAPDEISDAISDELYKLGDLGRKVSISGDSSSYSRREYEAIEKINGGHRDY